MLTFEKSCFLTYFSISLASTENENNKLAIKTKNNLYNYNSSGLAILPKTTIIGAITNYLVSAEEKNFQPMNANFGILSPLDKVIRDKSLKKQEYSNRAIMAIKEYKENNDVEF